jgi:hypothetical protein
MSYERQQMLIALNIQTPLYISHNIGFKIILVLRQILWHFVIHFVEDVCNEVLMKVSKKIGRWTLC